MKVSRAFVQKLSCDVFQRHDHTYQGWCEYLTEPEGGTCHRIHNRFPSNSIRAKSATNPPEPDRRAEPQLSVKQTASHPIQTTRSRRVLKLPAHKTTFNLADQYKQYKHLFLFRMMLVQDGQNCSCCYIYLYFYLLLFRLKRKQKRGRMWQYTVACSQVKTRCLTFEYVIGQSETIALRVPCACMLEMQRSVHRILMKSW